MHPLTNNRAPVLSRAVARSPACPLQLPHLTPIPCQTVMCGLSRSRDAVRSGRTEGAVVRQYHPTAKGSVSPPRHGHTVGGAPVDTAEPIPNHTDHDTSSAHTALTHSPRTADADNTRARTTPTTQHATYRAALQVHRQQRRKQHRHVNTEPNRRTTEKKREKGYELDKQQACTYG